MDSKQQKKIPHTSSMRWRRVGAGVGLTVALVGAAAGIAGAVKSSDAQPPAPPRPEDVHPIYPGHTPVGDHTGAVRGFTADADWDRMLNTGVDPVLPLGTGKIPVHGLVVRDRAGNVTGYFVVEGGFVERAVAESPQRMDAYLETWQNDPPRIEAAARARSEAQAAAEADRAARQAEVERTAQADAGG